MSNRSLKSILYLLGLPRWSSPFSPFDFYIYDNKTLVSVMTDPYVYKFMQCKQRLSKMCTGVNTAYKNHGLAIVHFLIRGFKRTNRNQLDLNKSRGEKTSPW